jgi:hypothetical protein
MPHGSLVDGGASRASEPNSVLLPGYCYPPEKMTLVPLAFFLLCPFLSSFFMIIATIIDLSLKLSDNNDYNK